MTPSQRWIVGEKSIFRADLLEGFEIEKTQEDLLKSSPKETLGGPASRRITVYGRIRIGQSTSCRFVLKEGFKNWDAAETAIADMIRYINSEATDLPAFYRMGDA